MSDDPRAARYSDLFDSHDAHASDCAYCPICATIAVVRNTKPEVLEHLASAAREMILAAGLLLEEAGEAIGSHEQGGPGRKDKRASVRRIDIG